MKKQLLFIIFCFCILHFAFAQQYEWQLIDLSLISGTPDFSDIHVVDEDVALISCSSQANIFRTDDGAGSFTTQTTSLGTSTEAIYMIDSSIGFCGGASGFVYNTGDGGTNWGFLGTMATLLTHMEFVSTSQGYACGNGGAVFSITGVVTNLNSGLSTDLDGISAPSVDNVWVCGGSTISYYNGSSFSFQSGPAGTYNSICFINNQEGWVVGNNGLIGHTLNGGGAWTQQTNPSSNSLYDVFFLDTDKGWAVGAQGTILYTANGGDTWSVQGSGLTTAFLRGVHFTSPTNGYVVGNGKTLLKYTEVSGIGDELVETLQFDIYPNPAHNKIEIRSSEFSTKNCTIQISDLNGKNLIEKQIAGGYEKVEIDVNSLAGGVYFCTLKTGKKSSTKKLIIE